LGWDFGGFLGEFTQQNPLGVWGTSAGVSTQHNSLHHPTDQASSWAMSLILDGG